MGYPIQALIFWLVLVATVVFGSTLVSAQRWARNSRLALVWRRQDVRVGLAAGALAILMGYLIATQV